MCTDLSLLSLRWRTWHITGDRKSTIWDGPSNFGANLAVTSSTAYDKWCSLAHTTSPIFGSHCIHRRLFCIAWSSDTFSRFLRTILKISLIFSAFLSCSGCRFIVSLSHCPDPGLDWVRLRLGPLGPHTFCTWLVLRLGLCFVLIYALPSDSSARVMSAHDRISTLFVRLTCSSPW